MERRSGACGCSDEDVVVIFSSIMQWDVGIFRASPSGGRRSAGGLAEQDLLAFLGDGGAARVRLAFGVGPLRPGALAHRVEPAPQVREVIQILVLALPGNDPRIGSHVGNAVAVAGDERAVFEMTVDHAVETVRLLHVALDRIRNFAWCVDADMVVLSGHRSQPARLPGRAPQARTVRVTASCWRSARTESCSDRSARMLGSSIRADS